MLQKRELFVLIRIFEKKDLKCNLKKDRKIGEYFLVCFFVYEFIGIRYLYVFEKRFEYQFGIGCQFYFIGFDSVGLRLERCVVN